MPHFTIEYSANLDQRIDMRDLVDEVRRAAADTGVFPLGGIRVRAIRCEDYAIADGNPEFAFLAMVLRMGHGRDLATRQRAGERVFNALVAHLEPVFKSSRLSLSLDIIENSDDTSWKKNNIHDYLKSTR